MKVPDNHISTVYSYYLSRLKTKFSDVESSILLKRLLSFYLEIPEFKIPNLLEDIRLNESELLNVHFGVKDLLRDKPLEYILGEVSFYEHRFEVNEHTLIPRPETEELVDFLWKQKSVLRKDSKIFEVGTGSGCIAIMLSKLLDASVEAVDISGEALKVAHRNAVEHHADVNFKQMDFLDRSAWQSLGQYDVVVSNPPYVRELEKKMMAPKVLDFEPSSALFVSDNNPLVFYEAIAQFCKSHLKPKGIIMVEINEFLGKDTVAVFQDILEEVILIQDLNGKDRFVFGSKKA